MQVIIFKNDASKSFFSVAYIGLCFYHSKQYFGKLVRALPHNLHFKWSTLVLWNKDKQAKNAQGENTYTLHIFFAFETFSSSFSHLTSCYWVEHIFHKEV